MSKLEMSMITESHGYRTYEGLKKEVAVSAAYEKTHGYRAYENLKKEVAAGGENV